MAQIDLKDINDKFLLKKDNSFSSEKEEFHIIEDGEDLTELQRIAAVGTSKGFKRAQKISSNVVIAQQGKLIIKRQGKPNQVISKSEERIVKVGDKISL